MTTQQQTAVFETHLNIGSRRQGKVRDVYTLPPADGQPSKVIIVASDRVSAFDVVMANPIPGKGQMLTDISVKWFDFIRNMNIISDHLLSTDPDDIDNVTPEEKQQLRGRTMIGRAAQVIPIECVARGYITGSGWKEYQQTGEVCGIKLPENLQECQQLPEPIFTPATKEDVGHDENIDFEKSCNIAGKDVMTKLRDITLNIYNTAADYARQRGIILADTKFEFGYALDENNQPTDEIILIDEVLTPDSSRFWPADEYEPGRDQNSFDKQYVRNYLKGLVTAGTWDKNPPGPNLPDEIIRNTLDRYEEARQKLFGG